MPSQSGGIQMKNEKCVELVEVKKLNVFAERRIDV
jgi:hypothetical protein